MGTFLQVMLCLGIIGAFVGLVVHVIIKAINRDIAQTEACNYIANGHRENMRALLLIHGKYLTKEQRRNAELWLAGKDGLL